MIQLLVVQTLLLVLVVPDADEGAELKQQVHPVNLGITIIHIVLLVSYNMMNQAYILFTVYYNGNLFIKKTI